MKKSEPIGGKLLTREFMVLVIVALIGGWFLLKRFMFGIGAVSNMNDAYPWGIWIAYDVVVGTAFGCGGFSMALLVYVFNRGEYHPLIRPALLASTLGYTLAAASIFFDIGRYWQMYNLFLPWYANTSSVMLEVALCIGAYCFVLWFELSPVILEKIKAKKLQATMNRIMFVLIALGILLPMMHQSSLGTMMIVAGRKLSPLWWTPMLPLLFLISAITMGYAFVLFEASITTLRSRSPHETQLLARLSSVFSWLIGFYLTIRMVDVIFRGQVGLAFRGDLLGNLFVIENLLLVFPMVILASPVRRNMGRARFFSAVCLVLSGALYRFNTYIIGYNPGANWTYFPSVPEISISLAIVAVELMVYLWFIRRLPVFQRA